MLTQLLDAVTPADLQALVENGVRESRRIEYKRELPGNTDADKKEFLADVSSFANAGGGDILFGVEAKDGVPTAILGLADFNEEPEQLRLENMIRDGIDPRIPGVHLRAVPGFPAGPVLVIRVPKSWIAPHMVAFKGSSRFYSRTGAGKSQLDVRELRAAFEVAGNLTQRIQRWRDERLGRLIANEGAMPLRSSGMLVLHLVPLDALSNPWRYTAAELSRRNDFSPPGSGGYNPCINVDGSIAFTSVTRANPNARAYTQAFRSGCVEAVDSELARKRDERLVIGSVWLEQTVIRSTERYLRGLRALGVELPIAFLMAFLGAKGAELAVDISVTDGNERPLDRDVICFPDLLIETYDGDISQRLRPVLDAAWSAFGFVRSLNYNAEGKWAPR